MRQPTLLFWFAEPRHLQRNRMLADTPTREYPRPQADHRHVDRKPSRTAARASPGPRWCRNQRPDTVNRMSTGTRTNTHSARYCGFAGTCGGHQPGHAGQVDELVHVAPGARCGEARSTMQPASAAIPTYTSARPGKPMRSSAERRLGDDDSGPVAVGGHAARR